MRKSFPQVVEMYVENYVRFLGIDMKFLKNKFFIVALSIAVAVTIFIATLSVMGVTDPIKNLINIASVPLRYAGVTVKDSIDGFSKYFSTIDKLDKENEELKDEVNRLEIALADSVAVKEENERLKDYIGIKKLYPDFDLTEALVIGSESDNNTTLITLNKGESHGIKVGMSVIVSEGLVGCVYEVGSTWCKVRALSEASASVGAIIPRSGEVGIVSGDIGLKDTGECYLRYLSPDADVLVDDIVYTGGEGSNYPEGLLIGKVTEVKDNDYLRTKEAKVSLAVSFKDLKYVLIITDFSLSEEESGEVS